MIPYRRGTIPNTPNLTHTTKGALLILLLRIVLIVLTVAVAVPAIAQDKGTSTMDLLRQKVQTDKKLLVAVNMGLTEQEDKAFWPIYDAYQQDLEQIDKRLVKVIAAYADAYNQGPVPNATAKKLLDEVLAIEEAEVALKRSTAAKLAPVLPATKVRVTFKSRTRSGPWCGSSWPTRSRW